MMRSLYAGVSGLQNHQASIDVIGNNIANVNTIGFKTSRMTFKDAMSETIDYGRAPANGMGGINPLQIGLGMKIGTIDTNFSQGILQTTNMSSDLAIEGDGFFIARNGDSYMYTRAGAFQIDSNGRLLSQGGKYAIQGKSADSNGEIPSGGTIQDIILPFGQKAPAKATSEIKYFCNLDASKNAKENILAANYGSQAEVAGNLVPVYTDPPFAAGATFNINLNGAGDEVVTLPTSGFTPPSNNSELISLLNNAIRSNPQLAGKVEVVSNAAGNGVVFRTSDKGGSDTSIAISAGSINLADLGLPDPATATGTTINTSINSLPCVTTDLTNGDTITISGINPDGTQASATFTYDATANGGLGSNVANLLTAINSAFKGAVATLNDKGEIVLTDSVKGESKTSISLSFKDNDGTVNPLNISAMTVPTFATKQAGEAAGEHTASIYVYDSLGKQHTVELTFTKTEGQENYWRWEAAVDGGDTDILGGASGYVSFNNDGSIASMQSFDSKKLTFEAGGGASTMEVNLNGGASGTFTGITQYNSPFTTIAYEQDGYTMGKLKNIYFDETGTIFGEYTNDQTIKMAQVSLGTFINEEGLTKAGDNFYKASANSGDAAVGMAGTNVQSKIRSGYLEGSNVDLTRELTDMIVIQRGFQANTKVINTADSMLEEIIQRIKR